MPSHLVDAAHLWAGKHRNKSVTAGAFSQVSSN